MISARAGQAAIATTAQIQISRRNRRPIDLLLDHAKQLYQGLVIGIAL
jgi:hypothetical protein